MYDLGVHLAASLMDLPLSMYLNLNLPAGVFLSPSTLRNEIPLLPTAHFAL
mgnify:CR=1 FL=1